ncbi:MAG: preprotein translocase subunit SecG [Cytophagales bacterium]|nr:preprotein translocase subunit SecG [Cytophagales bacterium]
MGILLNVVLVVQMIAAIVMIVLVLIQQGKGADMGAAFGSGSSGSLFGASGGASFMSRTTGALAAVFFVCTLTLAYFGNLKPAATGSVLESAVPASSVTPSKPAPAASAATGAAQIPTK